MKVFRVLIALLMVCLLALPATGFADLSSVTVTQVRQSAEKVYVYFDAIDAEGLPVNGLKEEAVEVTIDGASATVSSLDVLSATDEGTAYIFLMGTAFSLRDANAAQLKASFENWIGALRGYDVAALMSYGRTVTTHTEFTNNKNDLIAAASSLTYQWSRAYLYRGLEAAAEFFDQQKDQLPPRRILVLFTNGRDDGSDINVLDHLLTLANKTDVILYVIGYGTENEPTFIDLGRAAMRTGGTLVRCKNATEIRDAYANLLRRVQGSYVAAVEVAGMDFDISGVTVSLRATHDAKSASATKEATLASVAATPSPLPEIETGEAVTMELLSDSPSSVSFLSLLPYILGGVALLSIAAICFLLVRAKKAKREAEMPIENLLPGDILLQDDPFQETIAAIDPSAPRDGGDDTISITGLSDRKVTFQITEPKGGSWQKQLSVSRNFIIGRDPSASLQIQEASVSRRHVKMDCVGKQMTVHDMGSSNGLFVNGKMTSGPQQVKSGDTLKVGNVTIQIKF